MSTTGSDPFDWIDHTDLESPHANQPDYVLEHALVEHDHRPDEYAVTPIDTKSGVLTEWLTIDAADACDLDKWR